MIETQAFTHQVEITGYVASVTRHSRWNRSSYNVDVEQSIGDDRRCIPVRMYGSTGEEFTNLATPGTPVRIVAHLDAFKYEKTASPRWIVNIVCDPSENAIDKYDILPEAELPPRDMTPAGQLPVGDDEQIPF